MTWALSACAVIWPEPEEIVLAGGGVPVHGHLYLPQRVGPHPVVIDLHGCDGIRRARNRIWLPRLIGDGFAVLQVDSLTRRGVGDVCRDAFRVAPMTRSMDAAAALRWVENDERLDTDNVFLTGMSHGATTSLLTQLQSNSDFTRLKGVVAFYPHCYDTLPMLHADLLVLIGELDNRMSAERCREMHISDHAGHTYELVVYPDAHHGFDVPEWKWPHLEYHTQYNAAAAKDSVRRVMRFLNERRSRSRE